MSPRAIAGYASTGKTDKRTVGQRHDNDSTTVYIGDELSDINRRTVRHQSQRLEKSHCGPDIGWCEVTYLIVHELILVANHMEINTALHLSSDVRPHQRMSMPGRGSLEFDSSPSSRMGLRAMADWGLVAVEAEQLSVTANASCAIVRQCHLQLLVHRPLEAGM
ncbi:MAG: hypothetical protein NTU96_07970 [Actinobacteria bacterium]|nr:hypothetical protein [Actinomycetota bacterium]